MAAEREICVSFISGKKKKKKIEPRTSFEVNFGQIQTLRLQKLNMVEKQSHQFVLSCSQQKFLMEANNRD